MLDSDMRSRYKVTARIDIHICIQVDGVTLQLRPNPWKGKGCSR